MLFSEPSLLARRMLRHFRRERYEPELIVPHEEYDLYGSVQHDIILVKLRENVRSSPSV